MASSCRAPISGRQKLFDVPTGVYEIPGVPHMIFQIVDYKSADKARQDLPFLFQAFEAGQKPPPSKLTKNKKRKKTENGLSQKSSEVSVPFPPIPTPNTQDSIKPRVAFTGAHGRTEAACSTSGALHAPTIHEYLDWTVTAKCTRPKCEEDPELDFDGFRIITVSARHRPSFPREGEFINSVGSVENEKVKLPWMGDTLPPLALASKALSAATIRTGFGGDPGKFWIEVPFFATAPTKRGRGFGKALLLAIEIVCNILSIETIHLCSTNDPLTTSIWKKLGFSADENVVSNSLTSCGLTLKSPGLLHMDNTVQMNKSVKTFSTEDFKRLRVWHQHHIQVLYYIPFCHNGQEEIGIDEINSEYNNSIRTSKDEGNVTTKEDKEDKHEYDGLQEK